MPVPGLKMGPLDPDLTKDFGQVSAAHNARRLIRLHSAMYPPALARALSLKHDVERTAALNMDEVREYVAGLELENGDPLIPEGARVVGASVGGQRDREQVLRITFETEKSRRTGKTFAPYDRGQLPKSVKAGDERVKTAELREQGLVAWDDSGASSQSRDRENADLREQIRELRGMIEGRPPSGSDRPVDVADTPSGAALQELETLRSERQSLLDEVAALRTSTEALSQRVQSAEAAATVARTHPQEAGDELPSGSAADEPPLEDYEDLKVDDLAKILKDENTSDEERERILAYERAHANRKGVVGAGEQSLSSGSGDSGSDS